MSAKRTLRATRAPASWHTHHPLLRKLNPPPGGHVSKPCAVCFGRIGWRILRQPPRNYFPIPLTFSHPPYPLSRSEKGGLGASHHFQFSGKIERNDCHPPPGNHFPIPLTFTSPPKPPFSVQERRFGRIPSFSISRNIKRNDCHSPPPRQSFPNSPHLHLSPQTPFLGPRKEVWAHPIIFNFPEHKEK